MSIALWIFAFAACVASSVIGLPVLTAFSFCVGSVFALWIREDADAERELKVWDARIKALEEQP
jgi:hypothetical protein